MSIRETLERIGETVTKALTLTTLEEKLNEIQEGLNTGLTEALTKDESEKIQKWIDSASELHKKKKEWQDATGFSKDGAHDAYLKSKEDFKKMMNDAAEDPNNPRLAEIAKFIKKQSKNYDNFSDSLDSLKDIFSLDKKERYDKMSEGELLGELIFMLLGLIFAGITLGKALGNQKSVEDLLKKANSMTDPNKQSSLVIGAHREVTKNLTDIVEVRPPGAAGTLSSDPSYTPAQDLKKEEKKPSLTPEPKPKSKSELESEPGSSSSWKSGVKPGGK